MSIDFPESCNAFLLLKGTWTTVDIIGLLTEAHTVCGAPWTAVSHYGFVLALYRIISKSLSRSINLKTCSTANRIQISIW